METIIALGAVGAVLAAGVLVAIPVFQTVARVYPYAYPNARVRAMRGKLIKHEMFQEYLKRPYHDIVLDLSKKSFPQLAKFVDPHINFSSVHRAISSDTLNTIAKLVRIAPQETQGFLKAVLARYDIVMLQTLVRSLHLEPSFSKDMLLVTQLFSEDFIKKADFTLEGINKELKGTAYESLLKKYRTQIEQKDFFGFEQELYQTYYKQLLSKAKSSPAKKYAKKIIDHENIKRLLRGKTGKFVGGTLPLKEMEQSVELPQILTLLAKHNYSFEATTKQALDQAFYEHLAHFGKGLMAQEPLSEASLIGFLTIKQVNNGNLIRLLKLKSQGLSSKQIEEVLAL